MADKTCADEFSRLRTQVLFLLNSWPFHKLQHQKGNGPADKASYHIYDIYLLFDETQRITKTVKVREVQMWRINLPVCHHAVNGN